MTGDAPQSQRYEFKLVCQEAAYARLRMELRLHGAGMRTLYPTRIVQSIYFDTTFGRAVQENLAGISRRTKLRFRWYGADAEAVEGVFERKLRENTLGSKDVVPVEGRIRVEGAERRAFLRAVAAGLPAGARARLLQGHEPAQWIRYRRDYLTTADGKVRVTLDRDLRAFDQRLRRRLSSRFPTATPRLLVIEAKCTVDAYDEARRLVSSLSIPVDRCSKFVLASDRVSGPHASIMSD